MEFIKQHYEDGKVFYELKQEDLLSYREILHVPLELFDHGYKVSYKRQEQNSLSVRWLRMHLILINFINSLLMLRPLASLSVYEREHVGSAKLLEVTIRLRFLPISANTARPTYKLSYCTTKIFSSILWTLSKLRYSLRSMESLVIWPYKSKLLTSLSWS